jgi:hypothetical protein
MNTINGLQINKGDIIVNEKYRYDVVRKNKVLGINTKYFGFVNLYIFLERFHFTSKIITMKNEKNN